MAGNAHHARKPRRNPADSPRAPAIAKTDALVLAVALALPLAVLVARGRLALSLPPREILADLAAVAAGIALAGPVLHLRGAIPNPAAGARAWLVCGFLVWLVNAARILRGDFEPLQALAAVNPPALGTVAAAVILAATRRSADASPGPKPNPRAWTNLLGWTLALFWIAAWLLDTLPQSWNPRRTPAPGPNQPTATTTATATAKPHTPNPAPAFAFDPTPAR